MAVGGPGLVRATQPITRRQFEQHCAARRSRLHGANLMSSIVQRAREEFQNAYERTDLIAARELLQ
jgi:hypothetical protein